MSRQWPKNGGPTRAGGRAGSWGGPPSEVRSRACRLKLHDILAGVATDRLESIASPDDVRSCALQGEQALLLTREHSEGVLTLAVARGVDGLWSFEGRIWLHDAQATGVRIALGHEDHVVAVRTQPNGEYFELEEFLLEGWWFEVHLPSGQVLRLDDPTQ